MLHPGRSILVGGGAGCNIVLAGLCIPEEGLCVMHVSDDLCSVTCAPAYGRVFYSGMDLYVMISNKEKRKKKNIVSI